MRVGERVIRGREGRREGYKESIEEGRGGEEGRQRRMMRGQRRGEGHSDGLPAISSAYDDRLSGGEAEIFVRYLAP